MISLQLSLRKTFALIIVYKSVNTRKEPGARNTQPNWKHYNKQDNSSHSGSVQSNEEE